MALVTAVDMGTVTAVDMGTVTAVDMGTVMAVDMVTKKGMAMDRITTKITAPIRARTTMSRRPMALTHTR
jgi:hypothetical protein